MSLLLAALMYTCFFSTEYSLWEETRRSQKRSRAFCSCVDFFHMRTWGLGALRLLRETTGVRNFGGMGFIYLFPVW